ncbi:uncharacterized protein [Coffea arabica]|uniref:Uncharacterized protein isoform X2 n=1 Tax=Coffea arabica TaxID=13443 RepID=A0ABM4UL79_COFAR
MEEPLLSSDKNGARDGGRESDKLRSYEYVGRAGSIIPTAFLAGSQVSVAEIRSAASIPHSDPYPPSLHGALVSPPPPQSPSQPYAQDIIYQGGCYGDTREIDHEARRQILDEVEIRELLVDHVGHRCCWGSRPARTWKIHAVEDCNVYVGTLDTFIEEREIIIEREPYVSGNIDGTANGPELGVWELDLRSEFPVLFIPYQETRTRIPHSEAIDKCPDCTGRGHTVCTACNKDLEPGFYKENQMMHCPACFGRGLIAHRDGSDTKKTLSTRKVSATSGAASVPDDVFHRAQGIQLCNTQAHQCTPAFFADSFFLNKFSSEVIAERAPVPHAARVICERHIISVVPVTRVTMAHHNRSFSFYIIGNGREVYLKDYPARLCWGLCPCFEWLKS